MMRTRDSVGVVLERLFVAVCDVCGVCDEEVKTYRRHPALVLARRVFATAARTYTTASLKEVAAVYRDGPYHNSVHNHVAAAAGNEDIAALADRAAKRAGLRKPKRG